MFDHAYCDTIRQMSGEVTLKNVFQEVIHNLFLKQVRVKGKFLYSPLSSSQDCSWHLKL